MQPQLSPLSPTSARSVPVVHEGHTEERLYFRMQELFSALEADLRAARKSITLEMYIWSNDEVGERFYKILEEAALRGVKVQLVLDGVGSWFWIRAQQHRPATPGLEVKIFHPLRWGLFARMNRRNHKKVIVIDGKVAYTGSLNITEKSLQWKECGLRLSGSAVPLLTALFDDVWSRAGDQPRHKQHFHLSARLRRNPLVRSNQTLRLRRRNLLDLKHRIQTAQSRVWLMTPYFVPTIGLFLALLQAAKRGVDVRLILPRKSDVTFLRWIARLYYRYMLRAGVKIYEYLPQVLHAKISLVDDWALVGSSNLNRRSSYLDLELDVALRSPHAIEALESELREDMASSERILSYVPLGYGRAILARIIYRWRAWL